MRGTHAWVHPISIAYLPEARTPALDTTLASLSAQLSIDGCGITDLPNNETDLIITSARFGQPIEREVALLFHAKRKFQLNRRPVILTFVDIPEADYQHWLAQFAELARQPEEALNAPHLTGLGPQAVEVLATQARRGGPEVALGRFLQGQTKSMRVIALRTDGERVVSATHFDLAGAHPTTVAADWQPFIENMAHRILTAICAREVDQHLFLPDLLSKTAWEALATPEAMVKAGATFTEFGFFTTPVSVEKILGYRGLSDAISAQYSEGCYAVFEPDLPGLLTTATGSSRLVDKRSITRADQAIVMGLTPYRDGALVRSVAEMDRVVPSVEAVEMMGICAAVGSHTRTDSRGDPVQVPNIRAILHGHLGVAAYDPAHIEAVLLEEPYYEHLVSCGTGALAQGTAAAFARSVALRDLTDPRQVVFLEQPGHGLVVVEKWVEGVAPFEAIHHCLCSGQMQLTMTIPQGKVAWKEEGKQILKTQ